MKYSNNRKKVLHEQLMKTIDILWIDDLRKHQQERMDKMVNNALNNILGVAIEGMERITELKTGGSKKDY